jgi:predicted metal-dependent phosphoesterase TrpH
MNKQQRVDLHVHTSASDGTLSPAEVVQEAKQIGLAGVGIADHDTVDGLGPAISAGRELGIVVVPGVEINTDYDNEELHMLGYFIDPDSEYLRDRLQYLRSARADRAIKIVERLKELGVHISIEKVREFAGGGAIGRPHIARAIVEAGYAPSLSAAFGKYLVRGAPAYVPRYKLTPFEAVEIIHNAGGVAVFAHPGLAHHDELIPELVKVGLEGIEVYHTEHTPAQSAHYLRLAEKYNLVPTGGSDSHGPNNIKTVEIGSVTVDIEVVEKLQYLAQKRAVARL